MLVDTHAHLYAKEFKIDEAEVLDRLTQANVGKVFLPNIDLDSLTPMFELVEKDKNRFYPLIGLHPCYVKGDYQQQLQSLESMIQENQCWGIGECGLDLYWDKSTYDIQRLALERQIHWAIDMDLPIILHTREAIDETIKIISAHQKGSLKGIFHCFTGTTEQAKQIIDLGFLLGIGGVLTYKNSKLGEAIAPIGLEHLVLETDAPYLPPVPYRGKRNEPSYLSYIAAKLAEYKETSLDIIEETTTTNALKVFQVKN